MRSVLRRGLTPTAVNASRTALNRSATLAISEGNAFTRHRGHQAGGASPKINSVAEAQRYQRRFCSNGPSDDINPEEISFVDEGSMNGENAGQTGSSTSQQLPFVDVPAVDTFSRARVINFVKRYNSMRQASGSALTTTDESRLFEVQQIHHNDHHGLEEIIYHARIRLPFPEAEYGIVYGEGLASSQKDAELLAAMHAEYLIDAFGFQIYTLSSMQKKHAENARKAGRWAPMPEDGLRDVSSVNLPPRLRRVVDRDESEGGKFNMVESRTLAFWQHPHTMLSPAILDPTALHRLKNYFSLQNASIDVHVKFTEILPIDKADPSYYEASVTLLRLPASPTPQFALGKAPDRNIALILAAMHAEMIIDAFGGSLFPTDSNMQAIHAKTVRGYGRDVTFSNESPPSNPQMPKALKLFVPSVARGRVCARSSEEEFISRNLHLAEGTTAFTNLEPKEMDGMAQQTLKRFLKENHSPRFKDPYLREKVGNQWRATVLLPVPNAYGIRGGVGIAESEFDAEKLAAMHAIQVLVTLGIPISKDPSVQAAFIERRKAEGRSLPPMVEIDKATPSPPGYRRVASTSLSRPIQADTQASVVELSASSTATKASSDDGTDPMPHRETTPKSYWSLDPDSADGFIIVKQHGDSNEPPVKVFGHTLSCIRRIDPMAKNRIINYLAFLGKRPTNTFTFQKLPPGRDGYPVHRCIIKLPVPAEVGDRLAVGEGPELRDAEILACMHAELILDNLGIHLYPDPNQQLKHATAVTSVGRFAPFPGDPIQPKTTPTPPPLRMLRDPNAGKPKPTSSRVNPYSEAGKVAAATSTVAATKSKPAVPEKSKAASNEPIVITETDIDQNSRQRVNNYFRRNVKVVPEPTTTVETRGASSLHQSKMWVPVPTIFGERYAIGLADKKKDAEAVCYMHAERIIDALGLHLFNLPGLQKRHVDRVKKEGRTAPLPGELLNLPADTPSPPPIRCGASAPAVVKSSVPVASEMALQDFTAWGMYVAECEEFIDVANRKYENECYDRDQVPMTGDPFIDSALNEINDVPTDTHVKSILTNYLTLTNQPYPSLWRSRAVGTLTNRKCLSMVTVPGYAHLTALGVASSKEISQRRTAMHLLAIFKRLDPTFQATMAMDPTTSLTRGGGIAAADSRGKVLSSKQLAQREAIVGSWDSTANAFTSDGKVRLIELFTVCNSLPPPYVHQKQKTEGMYTVSTTFVEVTDEDGMKYVGSAEDTGPRRNEVGAYNDLFMTMSRMVPSFQSLMQLVRTHPHLSPEQIVDLSIPKEIAERMEKLVENVDEDTVADAAMPQVSVDVTTEALVNQHDITSSPEARQLRSDELQRKMKAKLNSTDYQEKFQVRRETLSIWDKREEILNIIQNNQITVVCGTTGCGKTTQLPQYILDYETEKGTGGDCNIVVTQPRRISATSISQRIADERLEPLGDNVGYTIRLDSIPGKHINFVTSGVLLRIFQAKPNLDGIRYVIIDEIHERDINSDFLLILMRELLPKRPDLRLILMSATLQSDLFSGFFGRAPVVNVEGYVYPVQELYMEDLARVATEKNDGALVPSFKDFAERQMILQAPEGESNDKFRARGGAGQAGNPRPRYGFMECHNEIDYMAVDYAIKHIIKYNEMHHSSILVFLPGWDEIVRCRDLLEKNPKYHLLLMHSSVNTEDQMQCFKPAPEGKIKIILSTNIAESGVTIDDIRGVVDVGRAKEKSYVLRKGRTAIGKNDMGTLSQLVTVFASRANCIQRRGRAGRTRPGMCIRLYTRDHFEAVADFQTPEMLRQPLDSLCLQILALNLGDPSNFLNKALEPPSAEAIEASMKRLEALGATTPTRQLTHLGLALSKLPVAPRTGKVILLGCIFKCLDSTLTVAATVELDVFNAAREMKESSRINRDHMSLNSQSDHLSNVNGFNAWTNKVAENPAPEDLMAFLNENSLFIPSLRNVSRYKRQFMDILAQSGFVPARPPKFQVFVDESPYSAFATDIGLVKTVIGAGLFPNVAVFRAKKVLRGKHDNTMNVSTSSIVARTPVEEIRSPFYCYEELMRTSEAGNRIQVRGITSLSLWGILLLGATNAQLAYRDDLNLGLIDDWIVFRATFGDLDLIKRFKAYLSKTLVKKLTNPTDYDVDASLDVIRDIIRDLVNAPLRPNNLVEEKWEDVGVITQGRSSMVDPTIFIEPPKAGGDADGEGAADAVGASSASAAPEDGEPKTVAAAAETTTDSTSASEESSVVVPSTTNETSFQARQPQTTTNQVDSFADVVEEPTPPIAAQQLPEVETVEPPPPAPEVPPTFVPRTTGRRPGKK